jgi:formate dehydrogenase iron-sulfur subunit
MTDLLLTPLDRFIREQQDLTAVERFSLRHDEERFDAGPDARARGYRDLLPVAGPGPGEQYAFEVDLDACSGCKACVSACHSLNGLAEDEMWRTVGLLHGGEPATPVLRTVTTACHHCVDPACLNGCPVDAYEKDPITGIVAHLDDQCIGCSYCTLMCPYEVPVYDHDRGIVRKCDMCSDRLADGEAPACVQGCPTEAISISIVTLADLVAEARGAVTTGTALVPTAPSSSITVPTTRYRSERPLPANLVAADRFSLQPSHAHTPLAVMLVLTQISVGAFVLALLLGSRIGAARGWAGAVTLLVGVVALAASVLHLGRPLLAWRAVLGLRHSWLSREIVAFGLFAGLAALAALSTWLGASPAVTAVLDDGVAAAGLAGVVCSVKVYAVTQRRWWSFGRTFTRFALTTFAGGASLLIALVVLMAAARGVEALSEVMGAAVRPLALLVMAATLVELVTEVAVLVPVCRRGDGELARSARLLAGDLRRLFIGRGVAGLVGGVLVPIVLVVMATSGTPSIAVALVGALASLAAVMAGALIGRRLFFLAVSAPRMPGVLR